MGNLNSIFKKKHEERVPAEELQDVRVMQDDIDELTGKPSARKATQKPMESSDKALVGNPFLGGDEGAAKDAEPLKTPRIVPNDVPAPAIPKSTSKKVPMTTANRLIVAVVSVLFLAVVSVGSYLFFFGNANQPAQDVTQTTPTLPDVATNPTNLPDVTSVPNDTGQVFSVTNPNYFQIDIESLSSNPAGIVTILGDTDSKNRTMAPTVPVKFLVRDINNNPVAFSRFAYLLGLKLPADMLSDINENFSLYFSLDTGVVKRAIVLDVKDSGALKPIVAKNEPSLPSMFGQLLYAKGQTVPVSATFHDGVFGSLATRYTNIDLASKLSFDNGFSGTQWIIGTSMDSFHSVLGQIVREQSQNGSK